MNTRSKILKNISLSIKNRNEILNDPNYEYSGKTLLVEFQNALINASAQYELISTYIEAKEIIERTFSNHKKCVNTVSEINISGFDLSLLKEPKELHPLDLSIINGELGVAENGAIWINVGELPDRTIPFICENLVIIIDSNNLVKDMHSAYLQTNDIDYSYGVFIAGPSKTADIEQTLVIGAQGPRNLLVLLVHKT